MSDRSWYLTKINWKAPGTQVCSLVHKKGTPQISWIMFYDLLDDVYLDSWPVFSESCLLHYCKDTHIHWTVFASISNSILRSGKLQCNNSIQDTEVRWTHFFSLFVAKLMFRLRCTVAFQFSFPLFCAWTYELETLCDDRGLTAAQSLEPAHCLATYSAQAAV